MSKEHNKLLGKYGKFGLFSVTGTGKELSTLTLIARAHQLLLDKGALQKRTSDTSAGMV